MSFQLGTWCWFTQTVLAQASAHASNSDTPQTVTQVFGVGSLEKPPTLFSIRFEVQTRSQTNVSFEFFWRPARALRPSSSALLLLFNICWTTSAGIEAPTTPHHHSTMVSWQNHRRAQMSVAGNYNFCRILCIYTLCCNQMQFWGFWDFFNYRVTGSGWLRTSLPCQAMCMLIAWHLYLLYSKSPETNLKKNGNRDVRPIW